MTKRDVPPGGEAKQWISRAIPDGWFKRPPEVEVDKDEILVVGTPSKDASGGLQDEVRCFRDDTQDQRREIEREAKQRWSRTVSWTLRIADGQHHVTQVALPVMTRLTFEQRAVLDILVSGGVANSRSEALAWCVDRILSDHGNWLSELRKAVEAIEAVRRAPEAPDRDS
ncbi:MAG: hypothetical protein KAZ88_11920 [Acidimicrobiia bacterium]|nr:hypothetical protein [Acidimicrobiia bacterium]MBP8181685.1 hypothetical protein [Acidimicrobiia bacterium]